MRIYLAVLAEGHCLECNLVNLEHLQYSWTQI